MLVATWIGWTSIWFRVRDVRAENQLGVQLRRVLKVSSTKASLKVGMRDD